MTKLQELCESGGCPPELWCNTKGGESCVKYAFWTTDVNTNELSEWRRDGRCSGATLIEYFLRDVLCNASFCGGDHIRKSSGSL